jgi:hypothetical protein
VTKLCTVEWNDVTTAREAIKNGLPRWRERVRQKPWKAHYDLVKECVGTNTYRAFAGIHEPALLFRSWAFTFLQSGRFLEMATCPKRFDATHSCRVEELRNYWQAFAGEALHYGRATKMFNLLVRDACESYLIGSDFEHIMNYIHVPLDECVLKAVRACVQEDLQKANCEELPKPKKLSMGVITTEKQYRTIQNSIRSLAKAVDAPPIVVDFLAWVEPHGSHSEGEAGSNTNDD